MDRSRNRWLLRFAVIAIVGVGMLVWSLRQPGQNMLTVVNQSGQAITALTASAGEQSGTFHDLAPGGELPVPFITHGNQPFSLHVTFADGSQRHWELMRGGSLDTLRLLVTPTTIMPQPKNRT